MAAPNPGEFGDFQTPESLALEVCHLLFKRHISPLTVLEPTCGKGSFLSASVQVFPELRWALGYDLNQAHVVSARKALKRLSTQVTSKIEGANFFEKNWEQLLKKLPGPLLIVGNPPWVTNSGLGRIESLNLPKKAVPTGLKGLDCITGKSNFDISEWMLMRLLRAIQSTNAHVAMLVKTSVARKVLTNAYKESLFFTQARLYPIDSQRYFGVSVDAALFEFSATHSRRDYYCDAYSNLQAKRPTSRFGLVDSDIVANLDAYHSCITSCIISGKPRLKSTSTPYLKWRSGIKHDCSHVMELHKIQDLGRGALLNGKSKPVRIEKDFLYGLLKSSDLGRRPLPLGKRYVIVTQKKLGEETSKIKRQAPKTWHYLSQNSAALNSRKSSIYRGKPPFAIFGVGDYSFAPWKVAISGLYKQTRFTLVGPHAGKPVMLDDTCYFLPFSNRKEALKHLNYLNSSRIQSFLNSIVFWDAKRPINSQILGRLQVFFA